ncbi:hypothetical protein [Indioceanicola profundi]|uniref:hypothetical protein n=1 Tax=Indioceanicola profundi TaxID=2220096 RepID=UPI000E6AB73A|nr:hypothetical protein [Indioceanicola profundi]
MSARKNPLNLNALQLKTLTIFQALSELEGVGQPIGDGEIAVMELPWSHGSHFHLGPWIVASQDATGLRNPSPWVALERKGLIRSQYPIGFILTREGSLYDTGLRDQILMVADHGI